MEAKFSQRVKEARLSDDTKAISINDRLVTFWFFLGSLSLSLVDSVKTSVKSCLASNTVSTVRSLVILAIGLTSSMFNESYTLPFVSATTHDLAVSVFALQNNDNDVIKINNKRYN